MPTPAHPDVLDFLLARRSVPAKRLGAPYPDRATIETLLTAAARSPDHGKLMPWRFAVLAQPACARLSDLVLEVGSEEHREPMKLTKQAGIFCHSACIVAVISAPDADASVPLIDQQMSAAAVCMNLVNAAEAAGVGAQWLTGWMATHPVFLERGFGLSAPDMVAGFIHLGTPDGTAPDRPRPDVPALTSWVDA